MASTPGTKARTELNLAIGYVDRATRRLAGAPGSLRHARTLERLSGELAEVLAKLIAADQRHPPSGSSAPSDPSNARLP